MNYNRKLIIQALAVLIFSILLYRVWDIFDAKVFYLELLCFVEIAIQFAYLIFNRKKLTKEERERELIVIVIYLIVVLGIYLYSLLTTH